MKVSNLRDIRRSWLLHGDAPADSLQSQLGLTVFRSWQRCLQSGLEAFQKRLPDNILSGQILQSRIDQRRDLIAVAKPTMNYLHGYPECGYVSYAGIGKEHHWNALAQT